MAVALSETMNTPSQRADPYGRLVLRGDCIRTRIAIQRSLRCLGERGFALLTGRWCTLQHITPAPAKSATSPAPRSLLCLSGLSFRRGG
jgi:hypothetical protein